jgi:exonuclease SbcC
MKILAIRGKNLASLEGEFEIDFTVAPLQSAGIFAITGPTGSGKSTLLDALCLALFDQTPRNKQASSTVKIGDVKEEKITQSDSRNLLRRGTSEGYAEVDFVALNGDRFRSKWSVRRSRGKVDGRLQATDFRLMNLTTDTEEQGRKTDLLNRVVELIGLTFYQFTRAVLLAQGDFATFLKAKSSEKAELLEKLTGTEVYSRISKAIYTHAKEAEGQISRLNERMKEVNLLSDEEVAAFTNEKIAIEERLKGWKETLNGIEAKLLWRTTEDALKKALTEAQEQLEIAEKARLEAAPRKAYLKQVEVVQEVSECYNEWKNAKKDYEDNVKRKQDKEAEGKQNAPLVKKVLQELKEAQEALEQHQDKVKAVQPRLRQARDLDLKVKHHLSAAKEADSVYKQALDRQQKVEKTIREVEKEQALHEKHQQELLVWFEEKARFETIVSNVDWMLTLLKNATTAQKNEATNLRLWSEADCQYKEAEKRRVCYEKEAQRLNALLPTEIAVLRAQLKENEPCPVCGSIHHTLHEVVGDTLAEEQLNQEKERNQQALDKEVQTIESKKQEMISLQSMIKNYKEQYTGLIGQLEEHLKVIPQWQRVLERGELKEFLSEMAKLWKQKTEEKTQLAERMQSLTTTLKWEKKRLVELKHQWKELKDKAECCQKELEAVREERAQLFSGESADEVERKYTERTKLLTQNVQKALDRKQHCIAKEERRKGEELQLKKTIKQLEIKIKASHQQLEVWLEQQQGLFTHALLQELLSLDRGWLAQERKALERLKEKWTQTKATLQERQEAYRKHHEASSKPLEEETKAVLMEEKTVLQETEKVQTKRQTEVLLALKQHEEGLKRLQQFKEEWNEKQALAENWGRLNALLGAADGAKFKVLAQGYTLDALLTYANLHLKELSKRYELQRIPDSLALQVVDLDMLGEVRTVHSLSGGESFLISLALALGLSSLSSNRMKVESLFIDEGFGSLDVDTLSIAMDVLERLQTQGRKIGVISHVAEMTERVSTQIKVVKTGNGRSKIEVRG